MYPFLSKGRNFQRGFIAPPPLYYGIGVFFLSPRRVEGLDDGLTSFRHVSLPLSKERRGIRQLAHFISLLLSPSLQYERGIRQDVHFVSRLALRVAAGGRNLKTRCVRFALAGFVEPSARVLILISFY